MTLKRSSFTIQWIARCFVLALLAASKIRALDYHAEHSIPGATYQAHFDEWSGKGYLLVLCTGFDDAYGNVFYNAIWHKNTESVTWRAYHGIKEGADAQAIFDANVAEGYRPVFLDGFSVGGFPFHSVIYHKDENPPSWVTRSGLSSDAYQQFFDELVPASWDLEMTSSYENSGNLRLMTLFTGNTNDDPWQARHGMTSAEYQMAFDTLAEDGFTLDYVSAGTIRDDVPRFAAQFGTNGQQELVARHDLPNNELQEELDGFASDGYVPKVIDAYRDGSEIYWVLLLTKVGDSSCGPKDHQNECSSTSGCQNRYPGLGADDCDRSGGGVCYCGSDICGCLSSSQCSPQDHKNECSSTGGCQNRYPGLGADDCDKSGGGVCYCGSDVCGCLSNSSCGPQDHQNECSSTGGCQNRYPGLGADDCDRSGGSVCYCGSEVCGCLSNSSCSPQNHQNECSSTGGCQDRYPGLDASDCDRAGGGVCYCGSTVCGCL